MAILRLELNDHLGPGDYFHFGRSLNERVRRTPPPHSHRFYECFWTEEGEGWHVINGQRKLLKPGSLVFIRPDDAHAFNGRHEEPFTMANVAYPVSTAEHFARRYGDTMASNVFATEPPLPSTLQLDSSRAARLFALGRALERGPRTMIDVESFLLRVLSEIVKEPLALPQSAPDWLGRACRAAREPEVFRDGAAGFVRVAGRGHAHVCRVTRAHLGESPSVYVNRQRMAWAARQLAGSDHEIIDIAAECGIENLSYFYELFREEYGTTPRKYRLLHQVGLVHAGTP